MRNGMVAVSSGDWRVVLYVEGGSTGYVKVRGIGWVIDSEEDMPEAIYNALLAAAQHIALSGQAVSP